MSTNGTDPQLIQGWNVQSHAPSPYAQPGFGQLPATTGGNGSPGAPAPIPGNVTDILTNNGYGQTVPTPGLVVSISPIPSSGTAFVNPFPRSANLTVTGGTVSEIAWAGAGSTSYVNAEAGDSTPVTVPGQASVKVTYSVAPTSITFTAL